MPKGQPSILTDQDTKDMLYMRDVQKMTFREIAAKLDIDDHTIVYKAYRKYKKGYQPIKQKKPADRIVKPPKRTKVNSRASLDEQPSTTSAPVIGAEEPFSPPLVPTEDATTAASPVLATIDQFDTIPRNVKITDEQMADKINMLVPKLLGMTEGEAKLLIEDMSGAQRISAASNLIEKMRLLRGQSTENVSAQNFVVLISKLTAEIRSKDGKKD